MPHRAVPRRAGIRAKTAAACAGYGFTLVEVLVALLIMSVIAAMGWQGVSSMSRARDYGSTATERTLRVSALVNQWELDLQAVYDSPQVPGLQFDGGAMRIARRTEGGVQIVVWSLASGVWRRWSSPPATRQQELAQAWLTSQQLQGREPQQLQLIDGVTGWQVYFFRGQGWSNAQSTGDLVVEAAAPVATPAASTPASAASAAAGAPGEVANPAANPATNPGADPTPTAGATPAAAATRQRTQLPRGVRLQIDLPEGRLTRDVLLAPQMP